MIICLHFQSYWIIGLIDREIGRLRLHSLVLLAERRSEPQATAWGNFLTGDFDRAEMFSRMEQSASI
jgi:hypothetical protein